jgi:hypothetical protein
MAVVVEVEISSYSDQTAQCRYHTIEPWNYQAKRCVGCAGAANSDSILDPFCDQRPIFTFRGEIYSEERVQSDYFSSAKSFS